MLDSAKISGINMMIYRASIGPVFWAVLCYAKYAIRNSGLTSLLYVACVSARDMSCIVAK